LLALTLGIPLVWQGGWPLVIVGLSSLFLAYGYTGGPFPLAYLGLGDLFVILYFGLLAVAVSFFIFTDVWSPLSLLLGLQVGLLSAVLIALNNLRDGPLDATVGKKTWAVRFGDRFVQSEITLFIVLSYGIQIFWAVHYNRPWFLLYFITLPLAVQILRTTFFFRERAELIDCLGKSAGLHMLMGLSFIFGSWL
jgi:1,4-dihydroxy-2-naphthoate polyprenyltransferase